MINFIKNIVFFIRDLMKTLYINFKCLPLNQAIKLPIRAKWNLKIINLSRNSIIIESSKIKHSMILLGYKGSKFISENKMTIDIVNGGQIIFNGNCNISEGLNIYIDSGKLEFGKDIYANRNLTIQCINFISIDDNCLLGWNVNIRDTDGHKTNSNCNISKINIGKKTWIASDVTLIKNISINNGSIVGCNSFVYNLSSEKENVLICGHPAIIKKENIKWEE